MFESDDWDFDQDFLDDVDEKAVKFYSQVESGNDEEPAKKRKVEIRVNAGLSTRNVQDGNYGTQKSIGTEKTARKDLVLGIINKNNPNRSTSQNSNETRNVSKESSNDSKINQPRKNLVLGILQKRGNQDRITQSNDCVSNNSKTAHARSSETSFEVKEKVTLRQSSVVTNTEIKSCITSANSRENKISADQPKILQTSGIRINESSRTSAKSQDNKSNSQGESRKQLLLDVLKPSSMENTSTLKNFARPPTSLFKAPQAQTGKKMTLVRRFPGPAGLLPDDVNSSVLPISYLKSLEENENERSKDPTESKLAEYCSQNTKNLFTEGAWQLMLDDLPGNFLKGYEIANVKQMAGANSYRSTKIRFLAGVLEYVDHSHDNPPIVLKDFTDSIQGIIHRDIPLKYPGLLEPNVVLLLRDVGLLRTSGSLIANKFHILISPSSLLGIYTDKGKIVHTSHMKSILRNAPNGKDHSFEMSSDNELEEFDMSFEDFSETLSESAGSDKLKSKQTDVDTSNSSRTSNKSINFNISDDLSFSVRSDEITNSQIQKNFTSPTSRNTERISKTHKQSPKTPLPGEKENIKTSSEKKRESLLQTLKKFAPDTSKHKKLSSISKLTESNAEPMETSPNAPSEVSQVTDTPNSPKTETERSAILKTRSLDVQQPAVSKKEAKPTVRSKLMLFRNKDVLTPPESTENSTIESRNPSHPSVVPKVDEKSPIEDPPARKPNAFEDLLCNAQDDSDDEMLSQLDVDTIFSNYNKET